MKLKLLNLKKVNEANMLSRTSILTIFFLLFSVVSANFQYKVGPCEFKCADQCESNSAALKKAKPPIEGYYWRNFDGSVPKDAFPAYDLDKPTNPKTYVGMAYNIEDNSVYTTTIVEGLDYVYVVTEDGVVKITDNIQILCTQEPEKFEWVQLAEGFRINGPVSGGHDNATFGEKFICRSKTCEISYVSSVTGRLSNMTYATMDGNSREIEFYHYEFLNFKSNESETVPSSQKKEKRTSFLSHHYEYSINPKSIIPNFYKKITIGSCSFTCTNQKSNEMDRIHHNLDYYWKPLKLPFETEAFLFGNDDRGREVYAAQSWTNLGVDVGSVINRFVYLSYGKYVAGIWFGNVLCSLNQDKFKWLPSNRTHFETMDKSNMIQGGLLANGTKIYVGRLREGERSIPASIRFSNGSAWTWGYTMGIIDRPYSDDFDVLTFNG